jgi:ABC-type antimicrobial peptide transport system permease subunit
MWIYGLLGFVIGFIIGMGMNMYLLQEMPREELRRNKDMRFRYGLLNWAVAFIGMFIALTLASWL